jgi:hypothetical protein
VTELTRRSLLEGAAAAGVASLAGPAASLVRPSGALGLGRGALGLGRGALGLGRAVWSSPVARTPASIDAGRPFSLLGVSWAGPASATIELRTRARPGDWSPWAVGSVVGHGPDAGPAPGDGRSPGWHFGEPIWTGPADEVQVRSSEPVRGLRVHFVAGGALRPAGDAFAARGLPLARPILHAGPGQPPIIAREAWGAGHAPPAGRAAYGTVKLAFVHHTQSPNGYGRADVPGILLSIYQYHRFVRGFTDIAYNFIVDAFGGIWEARAGGIDAAVVGAQAGGYNQESTGVAVLGSFMDAAPPPAAIDALERLLAWKLSLHGIPARGRVTVVVAAYDYFYTPFAPNARVSLPRVAGHRDGDSTDCPGDAFYARLPSVRGRVNELAGRPLRVTVRRRSRAAVAGRPAALSGRLVRLSGGAVAGAAVEVQRSSSDVRRTIGRAVTGPDGRWRALVELKYNATVRALHRRAPATVSDLVAVEVAPAIDLAVEGVRATGTVYPPKRSVTAELYAVSGGRRRLLARRRIAAKGGRFGWRLPVRGPGDYEVGARTAADSRNAAGASPPVRLTVP